MYYPQATPQKTGPTGLLSGSQYFHQLLPNDCSKVAACGAAGTLVLIHYDLWHRKMLNKSTRDRYMVKFQFTRLSPPDVGSIKNPPAWRRPKDRPKFDLNPIWRSTWDWLHGVEPMPKYATAKDPSSQLTHQLYGDDEVRALQERVRGAAQTAAIKQIHAPQVRQLRERGDAAPPLSLRALRPRRRHRRVFGRECREPHGVAAPAAPRRRARRPLARRCRRRCARRSGTARAPGAAG